MVGMALHRVLVAKEHSVSQAAVKGSNATDARLNANPGADMPIQIEVVSSMGNYALIASNTSIGLYDSGNARFIWSINAAVASDETHSDFDVS